uniref:Uncharacterized protein n=1 Tax=Rhizophora mucronata TaxID=61149 RepID=A0A2P2NH51_RHIMU
MIMVLSFSSTKLLIRQPRIPLGCCNVQIINPKRNHLYLIKEFYREYQKQAANKIVPTPRADI